MSERTESLQYDLWFQPWIGVQRMDGMLERVGIQTALLEANRFTALWEPSPLAVCGIHRLLTAILQDALQPTNSRSVRDLALAGRFPTEAIDDFTSRYHHRFDLFSPSCPFMQSADLPLQPEGSNTKPVAYLAMEQPAGTAHTHYRHGADSDYAICPACAAAGLCTLPAFATSGGAGIKPSINGVPPYYLLPSGPDLFHSLLDSLILPAFQPPTARGVADLPWWRREPVVQRSAEVFEVGYLASLTFPARRVRLHPQLATGHCSRCGEQTDILVKTMVFEMGESRPKDSSPWLDPFVAYREPSTTTEGKQPTPVRPLEGRAAWREFSALFLQQNGQAPIPGTTKPARTTRRPRVIDQLAEIYANDDSRPSLASFRAIGMRTDMKAKVFEWIDTEFMLPPALLLDPQVGYSVASALACAEECAQVITHIISSANSRGRADRSRVLRDRLAAEYWQALADPFRLYILGLADTATRKATHDNWINLCLRTAATLFESTVALLGDDAAALQQRIRLMEHCQRQLASIQERRLV